MANSQVTKRVAINNANTQMVAAVAIASFVTVFCLMASKAVFSNNVYLAKVITKKQAAKTQIQKNIDAYDTLVNSYNDFNSLTPNIINGQKDGTGDNDGTNSKIILDALPYKYDFPALATSISKILSDRGFQANSIGGIDQQLNEQNNTVSENPSPVEMPFSFSVQHATYTTANQLITALQNSIRPIQIDTLIISGSTSDLTVNVTAHTYYQPSKAVNITKQVVK